MLSRLAEKHNAGNKNTGEILNGRYIPPVATFAAIIRLVLFFPTLPVGATNDVLSQLMARI